LVRRSKGGVCQALFPRGELRVVCYLSLERSARIAVPGSGARTRKKRQLIVFCFSCSCLAVNISRFRGSRSETWCVVQLKRFVMQEQAKNKVFPPGESTPESCNLFFASRLVVPEPSRSGSEPSTPTTVPPSLIIMLHFDMTLYA
jgi:hypothetical protein